MTTPNTGLFPPSKRGGLLFHVGILLLLATLSAWAFWRLFSEAAGVRFVLHLLMALFAFAPIPLLGYRAYALYRAQYRLDRESLELRWGLRDEVIPLDDIEWVRGVQDLTHPIHLPPVRMPGALLGLQRHPDLGVIEFMASRSRDLLLVGTARRVYAISPAEPVAFVDTFSRAVELGSLKEPKFRSVYPSFVFAEAWKSGMVRYMWLTALFLNLGLTAWVSLLISTNNHFEFGFRPEQTAEAVPSLQLVILPLVSTVLGIIGWIGGLFYYRWQKWRILSLMIWTSTAFSSLLFLLAVLFIVRTSP